MSATAVVYYSDWRKSVAVKITEAQALEVTKYIGLVWPYTCDLPLSASYCFLFWGQKGFLDCKTVQCAVLFAMFCQQNLSPDGSFRHDHSISSVLL